MKRKIDNIDVSLFKENINEITSYILGILWADGSMCHNMVGIESIESDLNEIEWLFLLTGKWNIRTRTRKHWKPQKVFHISNSDFTKFLLENDYKNKSFVSADKILSLIPQRFKYLWFRGYWDGDGCFYYNEKWQLFQCTATGTINQDWTFLENLYKELSIRYSIRRIKNKNSYSQIRITNKTDNIILINFLYQDHLKIGFSRKLKKAQLILEK